MTSTAPTEAVLAEAGTRPTLPLRNLYAVRFVFALGWAGLLAANASELDPVSVVLLAIYPVVDVAAAIHDLTVSGTGRPLLVANATLSSLAAAGLLVAASSGTPAVLRVWGAWAVTAGAVQLVVALQRYRWGGQWPMILSGGLSVLAGAAFVGMASSEDPQLASLAGYAVLGGLFFLASAIRLHLASSRAAS